MELLKKLCYIEAPSGSEQNMTEFVLDYIKTNQGSWKVKPELFYGDGFQDCIVMVFGKPTTAIFAHLDSIGYTVKYNNEVIKIGGPSTKEGIVLVGQDSKGRIEEKLQHKTDKDGNKTLFIGGREVERGTTLTFKADFRETDDFVQCCFMDNRLGVWNALKVAEKLENGIICFSAWEEHGGGSVGYLAKFIYEKYKVKQALISDITWVTEGVKHAKGVAISIRDSGIPRRTFINRIIELAKVSNIPFQLEVENAGGSDGNALQRSPYPFDWCFIGAPEDLVHTPDEKVHKSDIESMIQMYNYLMINL
ncbi:MAG: aminopeptidase [Flavobacteriales bacterium]|nr:aminopeptidase [Flavobacteriales bacterium]